MLYWRKLVSPIVALYIPAHSCSKGQKGDRIERSTKMVNVNTAQSKHWKYAETRNLQKARSVLPHGAPQFVCCVQKDGGAEHRLNLKTWLVYMKDINLLTIKTQWILLNSNFFKLIPFSFAVFFKPAHLFGWETDSTLFFVEFLRALGSQSGVSVWQHTLIG